MFTCLINLRKNKGAFMMLAKIILISKSFSNSQRQILPLLASLYSKQNIHTKTSCVFASLWHDSDGQAIITFHLYLKKRSMRLGMIVGIDKHNFVECNFTHCHTGSSLHVPFLKGQRKKKKKSQDFERPFEAHISFCAVSVDLSPIANLLLIYKI